MHQPISLVKYVILFQKGCFSEAMTKGKMIADSLLKWFEYSRRELPWREDRTAYGTWISETMLQQTRVTTVIPYFKRFLTLFPDIPSLAKAPQQEVYKAWEGLGYYSRAANLQKGAIFMTEHLGGELPADYHQLLTIPGIGPYTAGAIASLAFGLSEPAVDGNVIRVFARLYALFVYPQDTKARSLVSGIVKEMLPADQPGDFNEAVMDLGASICIPGNPSCGVCPLSANCEAFLIGRQNELPLRKPKKEIPVIPYTIVVLRKGDDLFVRQRPESGLLANLFEFPSYTGFLSTEELSEHLRLDYRIFPDQILSVTELGGASHTFSHIKWEMQGYLVVLSDDQKISQPLLFSEKPVQGDFYPLQMLQKQAFPSALKAYTSVVIQTRS